MALRMMEYTAAIWKRLEPDDLGPGGEYPVVLPVVIYNGGRRWTAATDVGDLLARVPDELLGHLPRHRYLLIEIQAQDPAKLPPDNVLAMIRKEEEARMTTLIERARQWGKERDQEWLQKGIEQGIETGRIQGERELVHHLARDRFGPHVAQELSHVLSELPEAAEVPDIIKLNFECETAEEFLGRVRGD